MGLGRERDTPSWAALWSSRSDSFNLIQWLRAFLAQTKMQDAHSRNPSPHSLCLTSFFSTPDRDESGWWMSAVLSERVSMGGATTGPPRRRVRPPMGRCAAAERHLGGALWLTLSTATDASDQVFLSYDLWPFRAAATLALRTVINRRWQAQRGPFEV
jgi:hypothetical protein